MLRMMRRSCLILALALPLAPTAHAAGAAPQKSAAEQLREVDTSTRAAIVLIDSLIAVPEWAKTAQLTPEGYAIHRASVLACLERLDKLAQLDEESGGATWHSALRWQGVANSDPSGDQTARIAFDEIATFLGTYLEGPYARDHSNDPRLIKMLAPTEDAYLTPITKAAIDGSLTRLKHYQIKMGPESVPLNYLEAALYMGLQRLPGFGPSVENGPGPLEPVASYTALYSTVREKKLVGTSMVEFGVRHYQFGDAWGQGGMKGLLRPRWFALGLAVAPRVEGPLQLPFGSGTRYGGFFAWGDLKVAVVRGDDTRVLVTRQLQFMKNLF